ncbi:hypothetical protein A1O3_07397 [Capronia epimyces CBS 606.96]|uniref:Heterokaryon incompatibility domain-containing protein n=1 Tax=Capronia epimyces CBS 606.96 TaxID=1182542 RepID=W9YFN1_9EURO|nr:uncharacterized protein A1O3_07397 [Capronia epimyces CBS 606.96]EXJ81109.1 hypothetical protein A1O3_07397 [Capronia epimyces CBS 606.96]
MDHLPNIENPAYPLDQVPFLATDPADEYGGPSFDDFPTSKGLVLGKQLGEDHDDWALYYATSSHDCTLKTPAQAACFIQSWLFFGPLLEVFSVLGFDVQVADFVGQRDEVQLCTTAGLCKLIKRWAEAESGSSNVQAKTARGEKIREILQKADACVAGNLEHDRYKTRWALSEVVFLSIQLLLEALLHAWGMIYPDGPVPMTTGPGIWAGLAGTRMQAQGWCTSEIAMMENSFSATGRYFASRLSRQVVKKPHNQCNESKCLASQVDKAAYLTQHVNSGCDCAHDEVDVEQIRRILDSGSVPVIRIHTVEDQDTPIRLDVQGSGKYVAFSHVWAQGLGNATANSLPTCQLSRLRLLAQDLAGSAGEVAQNDDSVLVWIDTLCVPLGEGRKQALKMMGQTYSKASHVLVLDQELYGQTYNCSLEEICIRLFLCPWSRRLWTFKEGFLARSRLFVQFKEGAKPFPDLSRHNDETTWLSPLLFHSLSAAWSVLPRISRGSSDATTKEILRVVTDACRYRTTSWLPDETFCLAETAGLAVESILRHDTPDGRMKAFLLQCRHIPADVVFFPGPKLQDAGFRWAPSTFLYPLPTGTIFGGSREGICSQEGLTASWPSYSLRFPADFSYQDAESYYFRCDEKEEWITIDPRESLDQGPPIEAEAEASPPTRRLDKYRRLRLVPQCVLILSGTEGYVHDGAIISATSVREQGGGGGGSGSGSGLDLTAQFVLNVVVVVHPNREFESHLGRFDPARAIGIEGNALGDGTTWCIS